ncbi:hypothetical protein CEXT_67451 [Caerostris extrusa]|uniref:Uncharacterized protein n=1 Tax=Caerostris extrusa TaxID=172846 RepID=A0AAV4XTU1_CAEEX|nr:hypothetical protein CEXT_67451 [Caerostris extrusa]
MFQSFNKGLSNHPKRNHSFNRCNLSLIPRISICVPMTWSRTVSPLIGYHCFSITHRPPITTAAPAVMARDNRQTSVGPSRRKIASCNFSRIEFVRPAWLLGDGSMVKVIRFSSSRNTIALELNKINERFGRTSANREDQPKEMVEDEEFLFVYGCSWVVNLLMVASMHIKCFILFCFISLLLGHISK